MLDGDLLAYSSMAICPFTGLFLVAIHIRSGHLRISFQFIAVRRTDREIRRARQCLCSLQPTAHSGRSSSPSTCINGHG
jgi:hypothetical protein